MIEKLNPANKNGRWNVCCSVFTKYNRYIKNDRRYSWKKFCEETDNCTVASRLNNILSNVNFNAVVVSKISTENSLIKAAKVLLKIHILHLVIYIDESNKQLTAHSQKQLFDWFQNEIKGLIQERWLNFGRTFVTRIIRGLDSQNSEFQ